MQNHVYVICMYVLYVFPKMSAGSLFFNLNDSVLGLTQVSSDNTAFSKSYFILRLQNTRKFMQNTFLKSQNITATSYYGIENVLPDIISQLHHFLGGAISATYWCQECGSGL